MAIQQKQPCEKTEYHLNQNKENNENIYMYKDLVAKVERKFTALGNQFYCSIFATMHICGAYHHVSAWVEHSLKGLDQ